MNRRGFLKLWGMAVAGMGFLGSIPGTRFDPSSSHGNGIMYKPLNCTRYKARTMLQENMEVAVPPSHRKHVTFTLKAINGHCGLREVMSWHYTPPGRTA